MWRRLKRLITSRLDHMIEKSSRPDAEVRQVVRSEIARLTELEVQSAASAKLLEKELADLELKLVGLTERERIFRERGDASAATAAASQASAITAQLDLVKKQLVEARSSAARAGELREQRRSLGKELATETHITSMREDLAGLEGGFDASDPSAVIDEMKLRIARSRSLAHDDHVAEADRELEAARRRAKTDELLAEYKNTPSTAPVPKAPEPVPKVSEDNAAPGPTQKDKSGAKESKTLGPAEGPVRPID